MTAANQDQVVALRVAECRLFGGQYGRLEVERSRIGLEVDRCATGVGHGIEIAEFGGEADGRAG